MRQLFQDHLDLRADRERRAAVVDADGVVAGRAARDFDAFHAQRERPATEDGEDGDVLLLSCDGKGVVMRHDALRAATAKAAAGSATKLATRLFKGEKRNPKRLAEVGAVYDATPAPRAAVDVLPASEEQRANATPGPVAEGKWLTASVVHDAAAVVGQVFDEAERRDPGRERTWVALVDGNNHQISRVQAEARARGAPVSIVVDFVHLIEYLWKAASSFTARATPPPRHGCAVTPTRSSRAAPPASRATSDARPPRPA